MNLEDDFLQQILRENNWDFPQKVQQQFLTFLQLLQKWNTKFNLTAICDLKEMIVLHIVDSLSIQAYLHGNNILDVGSGAGLPGIPLALACPEKKFVLLDSNHKKVTFLNHVKYQLALKNVTVVHSRSEDFHPEECFDSIITRAFSSLHEMLHKTQHLVCPEGRFLAMKGVYPDVELKAVPASFTVTDVHSLRIKGLAAERHLICIKR